MAGWTFTGRTLGAGGGHRPSPRPGEVANSSPGLNQCGTRFGSRPDGPSWPSHGHTSVRSPNGRRPRCQWGRRPELRPGKAMGTPPGPNQCWHRRRMPWPLPRPAPSLFLSPSVPHRTPPLMPMGLPAKSQARRGDGHAAGPEPRLA